MKAGNSALHAQDWSEPNQQTGKVPKCADTHLVSRIDRPLPLALLDMTSAHIRIHLLNDRVYLSMTLRSRDHEPSGDENEGPLSFLETLGPMGLPSFLPRCPWCCCMRDREVKVRGGRGLGATGRRGISPI